MRLFVIISALSFGSMCPSQVYAQTVNRQQECINLLTGRNAAFNVEDWEEVIDISNRIMDHCANVISENSKITTILNRGVAHYNINDLVSALQSMYLCLSMQYADHQCRFWLALILSKQGDLSEARVEKERSRRIAQGIINAGGKTEDELFEIRLARRTLENLARLPF